MSLYHLTGQVKVLGYVKCSLYMVSDEGEVVRFDLEAYVTRNMKVPLLLGEDFQSAYKLGIKRSATGHCEVQVRRSRHIIPASSVHSVDLGFEIRQASMAKSMKCLLPRVWHKTYQRSKARKRKEEKLEVPTVLAMKVTLIAAGTVHNVPITGPFKGKEEWLMEKVVIATEDESIVAAPSTLIRFDSPFLHIANPSTRPWYIRAGDIVGRLHNPTEYADTPKDEEQRKKFVASAEALTHVIQETPQVSLLSPTAYILHPHLWHTAPTPCWQVLRPPSPCLHAFNTQCNVPPSPIPAPHCLCLCPHPPMHSHGQARPIPSHCCLDSAQAPYPVLTPLLSLHPCWGLSLCAAQPIALHIGGGAVLFSALSEKEQPAELLEKALDVHWVLSDFFISVAQDTKQPLDCEVPLKRIHLRPRHLRCQSLHHGRQAFGESHRQFF
jgi:hypothetical protein